MVMVSNPCTHCKNADFCKYVIAEDAVVLNNLRTGFIDDSPFSVVVECKYRYVQNFNSRFNSAIKNSIIAENGL